MHQITPSELGFSSSVSPTDHPLVSTSPQASRNTTSQLPMAPKSGPYADLTSNEQVLVNQYIADICTYWRLTTLLAVFPTGLKPKRGTKLEIDARNLPIELLRELSELAALVPERRDEVMAACMSAKKARREVKEGWGRRGKDQIEVGDVVSARRVLEARLVVERKEAEKDMEVQELSNGNGKRKRNEDIEDQLQDKRSRVSDDHNPVDRFDNISIVEAVMSPRSAPGDISFERLPQASSNGKAVFSQRHHAAVSRPVRLPTNMTARIQKMASTHTINTLLANTTQQRPVARPQQNRLVRPQYLIERQQLDDHRKEQPIVTVDQQQHELTTLGAQATQAAAIAVGTHPRDIPGLTNTQRAALCRIRMAQAQKAGEVYDWQYDMVLMEALAKRDGEACEGR
ncbi:hypothetical protein P153DRAFT_140156 [Dothidotthia symphoricarpi CBS 119687]|uniref:Uncharacterized protein n=1 Tax=Dothidotthia symphoricarpi CBS 119687 TaxID=1392245 RepID=A0A6A5ZY67_9PLEO|nr:uncharacterized protein P153DRAFT_140156 [Dothidotthia symphoricarpi CBS 119687]KAF2123844.1 hypothetical protein P153DRAFT_140156 [Dothidotthia symphoricarpi CBS 119687]